MKKLIILVSHYQKLAVVLKEYLTKMIPQDPQNVEIEALGGINEGQDLGTEPFKILEAIEKHPEISDVLIFGDLGSAILSAESIKIMAADKNIYISKGSLVENSFSAYVLANAGASFEEVIKASEEDIYK
ncbi:PTS-dependent dihydroxyacetone kinase phosphotransferase subunit DhaM [Mycoplasma procyoni]|uniref:PTS-dependent dihydroxyacetone kinase phosphotransferase subunit DhaM n=1 Tax=Mycoplasma procyoni TaxID=568784 RepID=UPI00197CAF4E|nr:dihydroxyacetone kinase [Mycoplasma procyoni]MBN3534817.1 dihydroxyacetone kinase [Mycoplasma procyoni]